MKHNIILTCKWKATELGQLWATFDSLDKSGESANLETPGNSGKSSQIWDKGVDDTLMPGSKFLKAWSHKSEHKKNVRLFPLESNHIDLYTPPTVMQPL